MSDDMKFGMDNEMERKSPEEKADEVKKQPFAIWEVGGNDYKLILEAGTICQLEQKFKKNLMLVLDEPDGIPPLGTMLTIVQGAMNKYQHGISFYRVQKLYDEYSKTGKAQTDFFSEVVIPIFEVSGFFTAEMSEMMENESTVEL